jgi:vacuolar-type H+-ATPase subunit I/STV1
MVESATIPADMLPNAAGSIVDERIEVIRQRVMTRENLFKIIEKYGLYKDSTGALTVSEKVDEIRKSIAIESLGANVKTRRQGQGTIAFRLSYEHRKPEITQRVANELVTLFLDENVKARTERASETTEFLTQEADKLKVELEKVETQLAAYKQEHSNSLPNIRTAYEHVVAHRDGVEGYRTRLQDCQKNYVFSIWSFAAKAGITRKPVQPTLPKTRRT